MSARDDSVARVDLRLGLLFLLIAVDVLVYPNTDTFALVLVGVLFVGLGLPHGAFDVWVFQQTFGSRTTGRFIAGYLLVAFVTAAAWWVAPSTALLAFIALSIHHFGEADLPDRFGRFVRLARGAFFVGVPLLAHPRLVEPILGSMGVPVSIPQETAALTVILLTLAQLLFIATHDGWRRPWARATETVYVLVWTVAFLRLSPLVSFGLYFTLWHALDYVTELDSRFSRAKARNERAERLLTWVARWPKWLPFAVLPNVLLAYLLFRAPSAATLEGVATISLILASVVTTPHVVLVSLARLDSHKE